MSGPLIAGVGLVYAFIAWQQARAGDWPLCAVFAGYAFSNIGLMLAAK